MVLTPYLASNRNLGATATVVVRRVLRDGLGCTNLEVLLVDSMTGTGLVPYLDSNMNLGPTGTVGPRGLLETRLGSTVAVVAVVMEARLRFEVANLGD